MDLQMIKELIALVDQSGISELKLEEEGLKISLRKPNHTAGSQVVLQAPPPAVHVPAVAAVEAPAAKATADENPNWQTITAPMVGTFYRAPAPDAPSFVEVGAMVQPNSTVCIIEAMKLMNEIEAEVRGKIVAVLVENGQPVEYGQPLFKIETV